uniref:OCEL domain-containing protein n=1 Tax=Amazona collaria TaxID=241587 RepID=A0A8B9G323_9PSIT
LNRKTRRISHLNNEGQPAFSGHLQASSEKATAARPLPAALAAATPPLPEPLPPTLLSTYSPPQTVSSASPSTSDGRGTKNWLVDCFSQDYGSIYKNQQQKFTSQIPLGTQAPAVVRVKSLKSVREKYAPWYQNPGKVKKQEEKDKSKMQDTGSVSKKEKDIRKEETAKLEESFCLDSGVQETLTASADPLSPTTEHPDYLTKYTRIVSKEQCESYKEDFYAEYGEYRALHAWIESITKRFMNFDERRKLLPPGSKEYQVLHEEVVEVYQALAQCSPSYHEKKRRCEYLHSKLSHIKRLIMEFDERKPNDDDSPLL